MLFLCEQRSCFIIKESQLYSNNIISISEWSQYTEELVYFLSCRFIYILLEIIDDIGKAFVILVFHGYIYYFNVIGIGCYYSLSPAYRVL